VIGHRNDIDGLRALAILPIVMFHAGMSALSGGFIGVDVFFVISGFLITSIIASEMGGGRFSLREFYKRRVVRIFPALFVMLAVVLAAGCALLLPIELAGLAKSAAAGAVFGSNVHFYLTADYFAPAAESQPLLHTWSLGVEEQFYLFYPLLLLLIRRVAPGSLKAVLTGIVALSFAACLIPRFQGETSFYLLPFRAWELGLGGLVALGAFPAVKSARAASVLALAGLAAVIAGLLVITESSPFPGPWAILPVGGTALLIAYGQAGPTARLLSLGPLRFVGAISYSLYLWHWPIIVFYRLLTGAALSPLETAGLIAASFVAGWLSYLLVEQPVLRRFRRAAPGKPFIVGAATLVAVCAAAVVVGLNAKNWRDYPPDVERVLAYAEYRDRPIYQTQFRQRECFFGQSDKGSFDFGRCLRLSSDRPNVVVIGDSFAAQHWWAISKQFPDFNVMQVTSSGCRPVLPATGAPRCAGIVDQVLGTMASAGDLDWVILAGRWQEQDLKALPGTIRGLQKQGIAVTVIGPAIRYEGEFPLLLARSMLQGDPPGVAQQRDPAPKALNDKMKAVVVPLGAGYLPVYELECPADRCALFDSEGGPFHFDSGHVTAPASRQLMAQLKAPAGVR
jgi:peptidoglycan/LPS O-acetylase OafA/YrhL